MKDSVKEFVDREIIAERSRFENKDLNIPKSNAKGWPVGIFECWGA